MATTGSTTSRTTRRSSSSATWRPTTCCGGRRRASARFRPGAVAARLRTVEPPQIGERRVRIEKGGDDGVPEARVSRAGGDPRGLLPDAGARRRADRREGREPLVSRSGQAAAAQRPAVLARWSDRGLASSVFGALLPTERSVPLHGGGHRGRRRAARAVEDGGARGARRVRAEGITPAELDTARSTSCVPGSSSSRTASPTSRTSSDTSRPIADVGLYHRRLGRDCRASTLDAVARVGRVVPARHNRTVGWFQPRWSTRPRSEAA